MSRQIRRTAIQNIGFGLASVAAPTLWSGSSIAQDAYPGGIKSLRELVELSKKRSVNYGSPGRREWYALAIERFNASARVASGVQVPFTRVPTYDKS